jgi:predicted membrane-bound dolichyl-phosphate-mannose-protein mannosyltransferase
MDGRGWSRFAARLRAMTGDPGLIVPALLLVAFVVRGVWIEQPSGGLIFDEAYYVNAARVLLGWDVPEGANYFGAAAGIDPNAEHPPLGKLLLAGSMLVFGDTGLGWRLPSIIAGIVALLALYLLVRASGETVRFAALATTLFAFDNLSLVHSRIATLDMLALAPVLVGAWLALRERWVGVGIALGIGFLVKLTALYAVGAVAILVLVAAWRSPASARARQRRALNALVALATFLAVGLGGLWLLDLGFTGFTSPIEHVAHMVRYGASLTAPLDHSGICASATSAPWQWPFNECQINYLRVDRTITDGVNPVARYATVDFRGALNPVLAGAIPIAWLYATWLAVRRRHGPSTWAGVWALAQWLPFVALAIVAGRVTYLYYFLPVVPAAAVMVAALLVRSNLPRFVLWGYLAAYAIGFLAYFPFRELP